MTPTNILVPIDFSVNATLALATMTAPYRQAGLHVTEKALAGGPHVEIVRLAHQLETDLIVIGAHGTTDRQLAVMGSIAEKVVRDAPCSVLTVRALRQANPAPERSSRCSVPS